MKALLPFMLFTACALTHKSGGDGHKSPDGRSDTPVEDSSKHPARPDTQGLPPGQLAWGAHFYDAKVKRDAAEKAVTIRDFPEQECSFSDDFGSNSFQWHFTESKGLSHSSLDIRVETPELPLAGTQFAIKKSMASNSVSLMLMGQDAELDGLWMTSSPWEENRCEVDVKSVVNASGEEFTAPPSSGEPFQMIADMSCQMAKDSFMSGKPSVLSFKSQLKCTAAKPSAEGGSTFDRSFFSSGFWQYRAHSVWDIAKDLCQSGSFARELPNEEVVLGGLKEIREGKLFDLLKKKTPTGMPLGIWLQNGMYVPLEGDSKARPAPDSKSQFAVFCR